jgi:ribonuclease BN (tRNA processing enzyme)
LTLGWPLRLLVTLLALATCAVAQEQSTVAWITLGTVGGPIIHADQSQTSNALVVGNDIYLFDLGYGAMRQIAAANLPLQRVRAVFISHHHFDHNADLGPLLLSEWLFGPGIQIPVLGPPGTTTLVNGLVAANPSTVAASFPVSGPPKPPLASVFKASDVAAVMNEPTLIYNDQNIRVTAISVNHFEVPPNSPIADYPHAIAFRVEAGGRSYVYSGDTGPSANLKLLAKDADVLVTEVVDLTGIEAVLRKTLRGAPAVVVDGLVANMQKNHSTPATIGTLAAAAAVKRVVLTHFIPGFSEEADVTNYTRGIAPTYKGPVSLAHDLGRF